MFYITDEEMINRGLCTWCIGNGCQMCGNTGFYSHCNDYPASVADQYACLGIDHDEPRNPFDGVEEKESFSTTTDGLFAEPVQDGVRKVAQEVFEKHNIKCCDDQPFCDCLPF